MAPRDLLLQLSWEHRDLAAAARALRHRAPDLDADTVEDTIAGLVEHELAHRLLVHPLLRRDGRGRLLFEERREEQLVLADRIRHLLVAADLAADIAAHGSSEVDDLEVLVDLPEVVCHLDDEFVEHADREEILAFPHLRRLATAEELLTLGALRTRLGALVRPRLALDGPLIAAGRWATAARRLLPELLGLPEDVTTELPTTTSVREHARS